MEIASAHHQASCLTQFSSWLGSRAIQWRLAS